MKTNNLFNHFIGILCIILLIPISSAFASNNSPLCFTARNGSVTVRFDIKNVTHTIQYSTDSVSWNTYYSNSDVILSANQKVFFRAASNQTTATAFGANGSSEASRFYFTSDSNGTIEASGNLMSLYGPDCPNIQLQMAAFAGMFNGCSLLTTAPTLPATNLALNCYNCMFYGCTSLTEAPTLPATTMAETCYAGMFMGCTSLIAAPALPSTNLADGCYGNMFKKCTSLVSAPELPATVLSDYCYSRMFEGCVSLTSTPELPATTLISQCYQNMFDSCISIRCLPALPATNLVFWCYREMFKNCLSLGLDTSGSGVQWNIPATTTVSDAMTDMFTGTNGTMNGTPSIQTVYYLTSCSYNVTVHTNDSTMGTVTGSGYYTSGSTATLTATANPGHHFVSWSNGSTLPTISFMVTCDTSLTANFAVNQSYFIPEADTICQGESYIWHGKTLTVAGVYYDSLITIYGSDSVYQLTLTVNPRYYYEETHTICQGETYTWHNKSLISAGVYYDSLTSLLGCDSVYELTLTVNPIYFYEESHAICQGETYNWHNQSLTATGVYYDSLATIAGCDSIYKLTLTVNPTYYIKETDKFCGESFIWHGQMVSATGIYYDSLMSSAGCDSIYELTVSSDEYTITVNSNNSAAGAAYCNDNSSKKQQMTVECGDLVEIHADALDGYHFVEWSDGDTNNIRNIEVTSDSSLTAIFESDCGDKAKWPIVFKYNALFVLDLIEIASMGYNPQPEDVSWWKVVGEPDDLDATFPADDQFVCSGHYMSLITNNLSYGKYYAVVDVSKETDVPCHDKMRSEIIEYSYNGQHIRVEIAPNDVKNGDVMTVFGLVPDERTTLMVYDYTGRLVETINSNGSDKCQLTATGSAGVYMVNVVSDSVNETVRFIVTK